MRILLSMSLGYVANHDFTSRVGEEWSGPRIDEPCVICDVRKGDHSTKSADHGADVMSEVLEAVDAVLTGHGYTPNRYKTSTSGEPVPSGDECHIEIRY